jgi:hypothetical protein
VGPETRYALSSDVHIAYQRGPTRGRPCSPAGLRAQLRRTAVQAGVRRRFAPISSVTRTPSRCLAKAFPLVVGGIRHVALEVPDAVAAYEFIRFQQQAYGKRGLRIEILGEDHAPEEITPFPYKFFYRIDPAACNGRWTKAARIDRAVSGIVDSPEFTNRERLVVDDRSRWIAVELTGDLIEPEGELSNSLRVVVVETAAALDPEPAVAH